MEPTLKSLAVIQTIPKLAVEEKKYPKLNFPKMKRKAY